MRLRTAVPMMLLLLLSACGAVKESAQTPVRFRTELIGAGAVSQTLDLRADYGDYVRQFTLACDSTVGGETRLTVRSPEIAQGITATVSGEDAQVSYGDTILSVEDFPSRRISPMAAPYLLTMAWSEGYIDHSGMDGEMELVTYALGYGASQLTIETWFSGGIPVRAEISDGEQTLIFCEISELTLKKKAEQHGNTETAETDLGGDQP